MFEYRCSWSSSACSLCESNFNFFGSLDPFKSDNFSVMALVTISIPF